MIFLGCVVRVFSEEVDPHFSKIAFVQGKQINKNGQVCLIVLISFLFAAIEDSKDLTVPIVGSILGGFAMMTVVIVVLFVMYVFFCFFLSSITFSSAISSSIVFTYFVEFNRRFTQTFSIASINYDILILAHQAQ